VILTGLNITVCGGATGGCAAALLLARAGASVTLIERETEPRAIGAGIAIAENGLAVLESLGTGRALAVARPVTEVRIVDALGRTLLAPRALVDAAVLFDELRRCPTLQDGLGAYERRRRKAVRRVAEASSRLGRLAEVTHPVARVMRDRLLMPVVGLFASAKATALLLQEPTDTLLAIGAG